MIWGYHYFRKHLYVPTKLRFVSPPQSQRWNAGDCLQYCVRSFQGDILWSSQHSSRITGTVLGRSVLGITWVDPPLSWDLDVSENSGSKVYHPMFNRFFHYFHHPFWGPTPIFGNTRSVLGITWVFPHLLVPIRSMYGIFYLHLADVYLHTWMVWGWDLRFWEAAGIWVRLEASFVNGRWWTPSTWKIALDTILEWGGLENCREFSPIRCLFFGGEKCSQQS